MHAHLQSRENRCGVIVWLLERAGAGHHCGLMEIAGKSVGKECA